MASSLDQVGILSSDVKSILPILNTIGGLDKMDAVTMRDAVDIKEDSDFSLKGIKIATVSNIESYEIDDIVLNDYKKAIENLKNQGAIIEEVDFK